MNNASSQSINTSPSYSMIQIDWLGSTSFVCEFVRIPCITILSPGKAALGIVFQTIEVGIFGVITSRIWIEDWDPRKLPLDTNKT